VNHPELHTIYPPAAQFVFAVGAFLGGIVGMKLLLVILDLLTCILIIKLLSIFKRPVASAVLYAWHPMPVIEIAASGHIDAAAMFFLFLSFVFLVAEKQKIPGDKSPLGEAASILYRGNFNPMSGFFAGIFFAAAVLTKWIPLIFLPGMLLLATPSKRKYAAFGFIICSAAMIGVFWPDVWNCLYTLSVYVANWEFSGFAFRWLRVATGSGTMARAVLAAFFIITIIIVYFRSFKKTRFLSKTTFKIPLTPPLPKGDFQSLLYKRRAMGDFTLTDTQHNGRLDIFSNFYFTAMAFVFFTPTLHPWYAIYLAAFLPFAAGPAGLALSWSAFLAYRVVILYGLTGEWIENDWIPFLIIAAPAAALAAKFLIQIVIGRTPDQSPEQALESRKRLDAVSSPA
jgi:hypothetical protein